MDQREPRLTGPTLKVLHYLMDDPRTGRSGADMSKATGVGASTLYPMLARLELAGWLTSEWEVIDPKEAGRPRRRFYRLSGLGYNRARDSLNELQFGERGLLWKPS